MLKLWSFMLFSLRQSDGDFKPSEAQRKLKSSSYAACAREMEEFSSHSLGPEVFHFRLGQQSARRMDRFSITFRRKWWASAYVSAREAANVKNKLTAAEPAIDAARTTIVAIEQGQRKSQDSRTAEACGTLSHFG